MAGAKAKAVAVPHAGVIVERGLLHGMAFYILWSLIIAAGEAPGARFSGVGVAEELPWERSHVKLSPQIAE
jgi:hypothetical protein